MHRWPEHAGGCRRRRRRRLPPDDPFEAQRLACAFQAGALPAETLGGVPSALPIEHLIVLMQENRSFDHLLGQHPATQSAGMDGIPSGYTNLDGTGGTRAPAHATTSCIASDPPHDWVSVHATWDNGAMDRFWDVSEQHVPGSGQDALSYYAPSDVPFYTWLYGTFAASDRYFCSLLGPTDPNRRYLLMGTSNGMKNSGDPLVARSGASSTR